MLENTGIPGSGGFFFKIIQWNPAASEGLANSPVITLHNLPPSEPPNNPQIINSIGDSEYANWSTLYSQTKIKRIKIKYTPAQTMGVTNMASGSGVTTFAAQDAVIVTCPVYDNVDSVISGAGASLIEPTTASYSNLKQKPYARVHSIYKPFVRIIKPQLTIQYNDYPGASPFRVKSDMWLDLSPGGVYNYGCLVMMMRALRRAGEYTVLTPPPLDFPSVGSVFVLGTVTMTYTQLFKTRY